MSRQDSGTESWDVFVSYRWSDARLLDRVVPSLLDHGLRVFVDDTAVDDFTSISATITRALARSKVLLALYSAEYPRQRACQWELTYAYLAGQRDGDPRRRILVINPEATTGHVHPVELRDARHWPLPQDTRSAGDLATRVAKHLATVDTTMGDTAPPAPVRWLPAPARSGSRHFTGRLTEQWRVHSALHRHRAPLVSPASDGRTAQLRGMPGIGKSLLAQEYALRFGPSYPGGIFWFDLHGCSAGTPSDVLEFYRGQVCTVASALGVETGRSGLPELLSRLGQWTLKHGAAKDALPYFQQAVLYATSWADAMYNLAVAQNKAGEAGEARRTLDAILAQQPDYARAAQLKAKLEGGSPQRKQQGT